MDTKDVNENGAAVSAPPGFLLPCPCCGTQDAGILLSLADLDDEEAAFVCRECDAEFGAARVREFVRRWQEVLAWVAGAPRFGRDQE